MLFTDNETNTQRVFGVPNRSPYVKDGINNHVVNGQANAVNPDMTGSKVASHYRVTVPPGGSRAVRLRLSDVAPEALPQANGHGAAPFGPAFEQAFAARKDSGLIPEVNRALGELRADGTLKGISEKYFGSDVSGA